jgi:glucokinase
VVLGGAMNFGGGDCPIGRRFLQGIVDDFRDRTFEKVFTGTSIKFASLGADAGYLGVAGFAMKEDQSG